MSKLITVVGATGNQGRAVIAALVGDTNYTLRGLTRNPASSASQELRRQGVEVVEADLANLASLKAAFAGSYAVYGVTAPIELLADNEMATVEKIEEAWGRNIAQAAAETGGLQHFIWSTLPRAFEISGGRYHLSHFASKNKVEDYIRGIAGLAAKTTFLFIAQYHINYSFGPLSIYPIPSANAYVHLASHPPETPIAWIGDVTRNLQPFIKPILEQSHKTKGNIVFAYSEVQTSEDSLQIWAKSKGVRAFHVPVSAELVSTLWGKYADFLAGMWRYWGEFGEKSWSAPGRTILTKDDLGVTGLISLAESFKNFEI
ncbi:hypothetical protein E0Z10_g4847 [Xylaria hypoxylon]|uniref:NmrA-like domain-containing protein n=1 Tax=Xylaria hypoxylon TaxID=37992 RepID=A0A4Z0YWW8_9PEZI|nr:hypothetical protein E0Z10_g4847 [Xylaria hypoxylon]